MDTELTIRSVQHYLYCPHRWGLLEINRSWAENAFVTKANLMHRRVHDPEKHYATRGKKIFTAIKIYCDEPGVGIYGVTDCLEAVPCDDGVSLPGLPGTFQLSVVEYKPTQPKDKAYHEDDMMQVFAQKKCVDYVFGGDCKGVLYYGNVKKRIQLPLRENYEEYDTLLKETLTEMREYIKRGEIPEIQKDQKCSGCSMKDLCMPDLKKRQKFRTLLRRVQESAI